MEQLLREEEGVRARFTEGADFNESEDRSDHGLVHRGRLRGIGGEVDVVELEKGILRGNLE